MMSLQMLDGIDGLIDVIDPILNTLLRLTLEMNAFVLVNQLFLQPLQWSIPLFIFGIYTKPIYRGDLLENSDIAYRRVFLIKVK